MKAAVVDRFGRAPDCRDVPAPVPSGDQEVAMVRAAAIKNIERMLVAGTHYASAGMRLPTQVGIDAVVELADGRRAYAGSAPPGSAMAEHMLVTPSQTVEVPDRVTDAEAAALPNAGVSAWFALEHAGRIRAGQSVLVLGATGVTGALAAQLATAAFGAGHVTVAGRNADRLDALVARGADGSIRISGDADLEEEVRRAHAETPFDLVLDFLWGPPAEQTLRALSGKSLAGAFQRTRFVQIGESAGAEITLPAAALRSAGIELVGQGGGSVPAEALARAGTDVIPELFDMLARRTLEISTRVEPLADVSRVWDARTPSGTRTVLSP